MKRYVLRRRYFESGTYSTLHRQDGSQVCCFVERKEANNIPNNSCVVQGTYDLLPHQSNKFGTCYALESKTLGVTRFESSLRTQILIHVANVPSELAGCLAPGTDFGYVKGQWGVINSRVAFDALMLELAGEPAELIIVRDA